MSRIECSMAVEGGPRIGRRYLSQKEAVRRYEVREEAREGMYGRNIFRDCQQCRPNKGKYKNTFSREEAGTRGRIIMGIRTGKYSVCVCKSENKYI